MIYILWKISLQKDFVKDFKHLAHEFSEHRGTKKSGKKKKYMFLRRNL